MPYEVQSNSETDCTVRIQVPRERVRSEMERQFAELASRVRLPGFRPGKVPRSMLQKRYGASIESDTNRKLIEDEFRDAVRSHELHPVQPPTLTETDLKPKEDGGLSVELHLEVIPRFEMGEYRGLRVSAPEATLDAAQVEGEIQNLRRHLSKPEPVGDSPAVAGDTVRADLTFQFLDGMSLPPLADRIVDTTEGLLDGIRCEAVIGRFVGATVGSTVKVTVEIPKDHPLEAHRGKTAVVDCLVKEIARFRMPEVDSPEFLEAFKADSVEDLREKVTANLQLRLNSRRDRVIEELCLDHLLERNSFPLPPGFLQRAKDSERERLRENWKDQGIEPVQIEQRLLEVEGRLDQQLERQIRTTVLLDRIAETEQVEVKPEDVELHFNLMARTMNVPAQALFEQFQQAGTLSQVVQGIRRDKVRHLLRTQAITTEMEEKNDVQPRAEEAS